MNPLKNLFKKPVIKREIDKKLSHDSTQIRMKKNYENYNMLAHH
jgi:hypothetical protein